MGYFKKAGEVLLKYFALETPIKTAKSWNGCK